MQTCKYVQHQYINIFSYKALNYIVLLHNRVIDILGMSNFQAILVNPHNNPIKHKKRKFLFPLYKWAN